MRIIRSVQAMRREHAQWVGQVGLVPTMGYLHAGHLSLVRSARTENEMVVVSIFVNPTQFGPHEDFERYPRAIERDLQLLEHAGVDVVFLPDASEMYPDGFSTYVVPEGPLSTQGEGASRPNHFRGVATIVLKLFNIIQPQHAYFGQKDAQQAALIAHMVLDLDVPVSIRVLSTVRTVDGLAMSSRNSYLDDSSRQAAALLYQALQAGKAAFTTHSSSSPSSVLSVVRSMRAVIERDPRLHLDYADVRDARSFLPLETLQAPALLLLAAKVGSTRLIDNFVLHEDGSWDMGTILTEDSVVARVSERS
jgi:pantoate--beta-alanine ligase